MDMLEDIKDMFNIVIRKKKSWIQMYLQKKINLLRQDLVKMSPFFSVGEEDNKKFPFFWINWT